MNQNNGCCVQIVSRDLICDTYCLVESHVVKRHDVKTNLEILFYTSLDFIFFSTSNVIYVLQDRCFRLVLRFTVTINHATNT